MTKTMTLAVDVAAYCEVDLPDDTVMTESNLKAIASEIFTDYTYKGVNYSFDPDWSTEGALRIVSAKQGDDVVAEGVPVEPCYHDTGTEFVSWLNGSQSLEQAIEASEAMLNERDRGVIEVYRGAFKLPGAEAIEVNFECRKGATREEKDLAFFSALADLGTVDYLCIGAVKRDYVVCVGGTPGEGWLTQPSDEQDPEAVIVTTDTDMVARFATRELACERLDALAAAHPSREFRVATLDR